MSSSEFDVRVRGSRLHVRDVGTGPPVLLLNGIGAHVGMWKPLEQQLPGLRLISFDAPGIGRSAPSILPRTMAQLSRLVVGLLDELELACVDMLGYSFGGALAQQVALDAPDRVRRLVLAATVPGWGGVPGRLEALLGLGTPLRYRSKVVYTRTAGMIAGGRARNDEAHIQARWQERLENPPSMAGYTFQLWAISAWSSLTRLHRIAAPTLIVAGDDDPVVPVANPTLMASLVPNARMVIAADEGHLLLLDADSVALPAIRAFLLAPDLAKEPAWAEAQDPDAAHAARQIAADGMGAQPWGLASATLRRVLVRPGTHSNHRRLSPP